MSEFRVVKAYSGRFAVDLNGKIVVCECKKKNKENAVLTGDLVEVENDVIINVKPRKNRLVRPQIANVDQVIIVICPIPLPDLYMVDKMLINCKANDIEPIICVNKTDIFAEGFKEQIISQYGGYEIIFTNALEGDVSQLKPLLANKLTCLAGQSAVGKSTLINALFKSDLRAVGELTSFNRGKNTTTDTQLFENSGGFIADTPGFSLLDIFDVDALSLDLYYPEFDNLLNACKFHRCTHTGEPECAIEAATASGKINAERFKRYKDLFSELKNKKAWRGK